MADKKKDYDLKKIFEELELDLIRSLKRNLKSHEQQEIDEGFEWEMWQSAKLQNLRKYQRENKQIMDRYRPKIRHSIQESINAAFRKGVNLFLKIWNSVRHLFSGQPSVHFPEDIEPKIPGELKPMGKYPKEKHFFGMNDKKLEALVNSVTKDLEKAETATLRKMDDVYRQTVYKAQMSVAAGVKTLDQAIDMAAKDFLARGIQSIRYKNGHNVNIASYAEMAIRTANHRAMLMGEGKKRDEMGIHTVFVSAHAGTCELCRPWQGRILIDDVFSSGTREESEKTGHPLVSGAIEAGLLHPNCRHHLATYFPGVTHLPEIPDDETVQKNYAAEQKQRQIERQIRYWKRVQAGAMDPEQFTKAGQRVKQWQSRMREHLEENPQLRRQYSREKDRFNGQDAVKKQEEALKAEAKRAKIKEIRDFIQSDQQPKVIESGKQGKHLLDHNNYQLGRSYLTITVEEAQALVDQYAGTGELRLTKSGTWDKKEVVKTDHVIGVDVNAVTGQETETTGFKIHYSKKGVHIVPFRVRE
ncbi:toxin 50 [Eubacterium maltosivorans]|uniref:phage minor capsid protein n=1 Tax=Eubacterium maltosivorans TaxID=2041044 RepID=UPI00088D8107|nr:phage minor capsid protein [Eubacterium maltosivorans]WPK79785.1 hypothetical protein EUMA32_11940 [Eubacterium maltosivorans]SDP01636.1 toxin 50 [Eubacterium maltosivorans]